MKRKATDTDTDTKPKKKARIVIGRPGQRRPSTGAAISLDDSQLEARLQSAIGGTLTKGLKRILGA